MYPAVVYTEELFRLGHGRPMWMPEKPDSPVEIGDVGFIETGEVRSSRVPFKAADKVEKVLGHSDVCSMLHGHLTTLLTHLVCLMALNHWI